MMARYLYAISSGAFVTLPLLFFMDHLIAMQPGAASDPGRTGTLTFIRLHSGSASRSASSTGFPEQRTAYATCSDSRWNNIRYPGRNED